MPQPDSMSVGHHLPLSVPVHQILLSLADGDRHGYALIQEIRERTEGAVDLTASTLYGALARMLDEALVEEVREPVPRPEGHDRRRRYYHLTPLGEAVARAEARRLACTLEHAQAKGLGPDTAADHSAASS